MQSVIKSTPMGTFSKQGSPYALYKASQAMQCPLNRTFKTIAPTARQFSYQPRNRKSSPWNSRSKSPGRSASPDSPAPPKRDSFQNIRDRVAEQVTKVAGDS